MSNLLRLPLKKIFGRAVLLSLLCLSRPATSAANALPRYDFAITLDYPHHRLQAVQRVTIPNTLGESVSDIVFNVPASHQPGVFTLHAIKIDGVSVDYRLSGTILHVSLPRPLPPDESIMLDLDFTVRVPELIDPQSFAEANLAYTSDALMAGYWYPLLAPPRSEGGWLETPWYPIGDPFVSESADYTAIITATPGVTIVSGGDLIRDRNVWRYELPRARTFGFIASPFYQTLSLTSSGKTYAVSVLPRHTSLALIALQTLIKAEHLFTGLYGAYPYRSLRVAEFSGPWSMEFAGFFVLGATEFDDYDGTQRNRLIRIMAHETSHQWWYGVVGNDQVREPWLDEGVARFNEVRYYEVFAPRDVAWWWNTVIGTTRPSDPLNSPSTAFTNHGDYLDSIYDQGARYLDTLRTQLGAKTFSAFLRDLYQRSMFRLITTEDFFKVLGTHTPLNLRILRGRFFH
ncbi:MAG TPA: M1 family metallopeptidase [Anaerolineae bacterium]|nr:M1 family metallopeptidase [Anaerolineae bacterium]